MALLYQATLRPGKLEFVAATLRGSSWYGDRPDSEVRSLATYRFDDPAGEVGMETFLVTAGGDWVYQVPLTYRGAPLDGGERWLIGTADHSVLGRRWIYDGCGDPVYLSALARAILEGEPQAEEVFDHDGRVERRAPTMAIASHVPAAVSAPAASAAEVGAIRRVVDGDPTLVVLGDLEVSVVRRPDSGMRPRGAVLTGTWPGQSVPLTLACAAPHRRVH